MVSSFLLVVLGCVSLSLAQNQVQEKPQCSDEFQTFHECMRSNSEPPPMPDFQALKKESDECFTKSGCTAPQSPGPGGPGGPPRGGPPPGGFGGPGGPPPGGFGGPPPGGPPPGFPPGAPPPGGPPRFGNDTNSKCFGNVHKKLHETFTSCMKEKDPDFGKNGMEHGPPPGGFGPPPGGSPPGGPPPGGPGGFGPPPGGPPPGGDGPPIEMLSSFCNNDKDKAQQLKTCMKDLHERHKPSKEDAKKHYDSMCKAEGICKPKLGQCEDIMKKKGQAMCECHEKAHAQADDTFKNEESCKDIKQKPQFPGPPKGEKHDCSKPPPGICEEGFDKFYDRFVNGPPPPPPPPPPQN